MGLSSPFTIPLVTLGRENTIRFFTLLNRLVRDSRENESGWGVFGLQGEQPAEIEVMSKGSEAYPSTSR